MACEFPPSQVSLNCKQRFPRCNIPLRVSGGPFHYHLRAGTYGDVYDEIPWKVAFGIAEDKGRDPTDESCLVGKYKDGVLLHNWVEDRRDKIYLRDKRRTLPSQFEWMYRSTYKTDFKKNLCRKEGSWLRSIPEFPMPIYPGHQQELDIPYLRRAPVPQLCINREKRRKKVQAEQQQAREDRDHPPKPIPSAYDICFC